MLFLLIRSTSIFYFASYPPQKCPFAILGTRYSFFALVFFQAAASDRGPWKCSSPFVPLRGRKVRANEGASKNLQRRVDVSWSIVKEQSSHASKEPKRKGRRRDGDCLLEELDRAPGQGVAFQKDVCTWRRRRTRNIPSAPRPSISIALASILFIPLGGAVSN